ncbi:TlpA family protein disulfide reductase [Microbacterium indicum]|uniref:TlpA family protein disulfide reductase n=1 Tax=Microbacterium indicum TaxID=358100 RepID=UPI00040D349F|nr:TlpA disulfide reductase family protein [Microbacterium indicum]
MLSTPLFRRAAAGVAALLTVATLASCSQDATTQQYLEGDNKGYISGDFRVDEIAAADRGEPVAWAGSTEDGDALSSDDTAGDVTVVNFWYASCGPCIVEAPDLEQVWEEYQDQGVQFVGVNIYDSAETAQSFAKDNDVTYPSIIDVNSGSVKLAFAAATPISATPTTLVLDKEGRIAARIIGRLEDASILSTLVGDALDETA